jgi:hypothetical protein
MNQNQLEKQLQRMERKLMELYLDKKRPLRLLPTLVAKLTEGEREKFFKLHPNGICDSNLANAIGLCERTIKNRKVLQEMSS